MPENSNRPTCNIMKFWIFLFGLFVHIAQQSLIYSFFVSNN